MRCACLLQRQRCVCMQGARPQGADMRNMMYSTTRGKVGRAYKGLVLTRSSPLSATGAQCWAAWVPHCRLTGLLWSDGHSSRRSVTRGSARAGSGCQQEQATSTQTHLDLVRDEQGIVLLQQPVCSVEVPIVRHHHSSLSLHMWTWHVRTTLLLVTTTAGMRARPVAPGCNEHEPGQVLTSTTTKLLRSGVGIDLLLVPLMCATLRQALLVPSSIGLHHGGKHGGAAANPATQGATLYLSWMSTQGATLYLSSTCTTAGTELHSPEPAAAPRCGIEPCCDLSP